MKPTLLILAAGMGSRFGGLKQVEPLGPHGETLLDYSIYDAQRGGFERIVFVIRKNIEAEFRDKVGRRHEARMAVDYAFQELSDLPGPITPPAGRTKPWGTTQAIWSARRTVQEPFATINADDFYGAPAYRIMAEFLSSPQRTAGQYAMAGYRLDRTLSEYGAVSRGICRTDDQGLLQEVVEHTQIARGPDGIIHSEKSDALDGTQLVSMNFWGFQPDVFERLETIFLRFLTAHGSEEKSEHFIPTAVAEMIREGGISVRVLHSQSPWFGVTFREDREKVARALASLTAQGEYPSPLFA